MAKNKHRPTRKNKARREPPVRIPVPFDQAVSGLLGLSQEDAKEVRQGERKKK
jgi:hypothetical protein